MLSEFGGTSPLAATQRDAALDVYRQFCVLNDRFKQLCTSWQVRDVHRTPIVLNDHRDPRYDLDIIRQLERLHGHAYRLLRHGDRAMPGLGAFADRLGRALAELTAGDSTKLAAPLTASYHDIWMELHEVMLRTLGLVRQPEDA